VFLLSLWRERIEVRVKAGPRKSSSLEQFQTVKYGPY
jgi:hypothetical protein